MPAQLLERKPGTGNRDDVQPWLNRRVSLRHPSGPVTTSQLATDRTFRFRQARILDVSLGGIGLVTRQSLPVGTQVWIQLTNEILGITYDLSARVAHATKASGGWIIGCAFTRELSVPELESLLY
jgi:hypothetical protein